MERREEKKKNDDDDDDEEIVDVRKEIAMETVMETVYQPQCWYLCSQAGVRRSAIAGIQLMVDLVFLIQV